MKIDILDEKATLFQTIVVSKPVKKVNISYLILLTKKV